LERLIYTKYSTDRDKAFAIRTDRLVDDKGNESIKKVALFDEGVSHLKHMSDMSILLKDRYGDKLVISKSSLEGKVLDNEFVVGVSFFDIFEELLKTGGANNVLEALDNYKAIIEYSNKGHELFVVTKDFEDVFGRHEELEKMELQTSFVTDIDMIFDNIIISDNGKWQLIDYEWTFDFPIPIKYVLFRTLFYLYNDTSIGIVLDWPDALARMGINHGEATCFRKMEHHFQQYVMKGVRTIESEVNNGRKQNIAFEELTDGYREGVWYKSRYRELEKEYKECKTKLEEYKNYKRRAEEILDKYGKLREEYLRQESKLRELRGRKLYKIGKRINKL